MYLKNLCLLIAVCIQVPDGHCGGGSGWHYGHGGGPSEWHKTYPDCGGRMQSPINIKMKDVLYDNYLKPFDFSEYGKSQQTEVTLVNKGGHTVELDYTGDPIYVSGGSLPDKYVLDQFHFHWGSGHNNGSEHTIDGRHYPIEMHIVHHQSHLNKSKATGHPFGLAVIGYMINIAEHNNHFDKLLDHFDDIKREDQETKFSFLPLLDLLPEGENHYFRYFGSLTTPPCYESVIWSIGLEEIFISDSQLKRFHNFITNQNKTVENNFRPTQLAHARRVLTSKDPGGQGKAKCDFTLVYILVASYIVLLLSIIYCYACVYRPRKKGVSNVEQPTINLIKETLDESEQSFSKPDSQKSGQSEKDETQKKKGSGSSSTGSASTSDSSS